MKKGLALALALVMCLLCFAGCAEKPADTPSGGSAPRDYTTAEGLAGAKIVAEKGSAGESVAQENALFAQADYTGVDSQAKALVEVEAGTAEFALIDYVMSIGSIGAGTDYADLEVLEDATFNPEQYGIAFRKGSDAAYEVNKAIAELKQDGTLDAIAQKYKLDSLLLGTDAFEQPAASDDSDWAYIKEKGKLVIGITYFAPMNYLDDNNELTGFETEFAKAVCEKLGVEPVFQEINWDYKETELSAKSIDCIWNGMTIMPGMEENMSLTIPYMENRQVLVRKAAG